MYENALARALKWLDFSVLFEIVKFTEICFARAAKEKRLAKREKIKEKRRAEAEKEGNQVYIHYA